MDDSTKMTTPGGRSPFIIVGQSDSIRWWQVGPDRVELAQDGSTWTALVRRSQWGETALTVNQHFSTEAEAFDWCENMADVLARDLDDEEDEPSSTLDPNIMPSNVESEFRWN